MKPLRQRKSMARWLLLALGAATCHAIELMDISEVAGKPVVEILFPPNDYLLLATELQIEIAMRAELLHAAASDERVCISMAAVFVPEDIQTATNSGFPERCFERQGNYTTFHASGLVPGLQYGVSAGLMNAGRVVGYSSRYFEVASIIGRADGTIIRMSIAEAMQAAEQLHFAEDLSRASDVYSKVLEMFPNYSVALHRLGQVALQESRVDDAYELTKRALSGNANDETAHLTMARCLIEYGQTEQAIKHYRRALELRPSYVAAALSLGVTWQSVGKYDDAMHEFRKVVSMSTESPPPQQIGEPTHVHMVGEAHAWLCELVRQSESWHDADRCLTQAIERFPSVARFHMDRGHLLLSGSQFEAAQREFDTAARLGLVHAMIQGADILESLGEYEASIARYGEIFHSSGITDTSALNQIVIMMSTVLPRILPSNQAAIDAERERVLHNVSYVLLSLDEPMGRIPIDPSRLAFSPAVSLNTHNRNNKELKATIGRMYHKLLIDPGITKEEYVTSYGVTPQPYRQHLQLKLPVDDAPRLRVGFVSRFLYSPAVGLFIDELLPQLNTTKYEVFAFGLGLSKSIKSYDQATQIAEHVVALPRDLRVARAEIRAANLDILIYPELGMDKLSYFLSFYRLARVQAAWWGNPDTSGVPSIDYFLASEYEHEDFRDHYTEPVYQMQGMGIYHELPPLPNSTITRDDIRRAIIDKFPVPNDFHFYLSIEAILHLHPDFDEAVRQILTQDPLAYVFLLTSSNRKHWRQLHTKRITAHIGSDNAVRLIYLMDIDTRHEMHLLNAADAVLSAFHLSRPKAAIQAFTAGVPVVTMAGELWASRIVAGFYRQMGIRDLTTTTIEEYATVAVKLATDESFRSRMVRKVRRRRHRLSQDRRAVAEWETFFDLVASPPSSPQPSESSPTEESPRPPASTSGSTVAAMTCPATSLLHLW